MYIELLKEMFEEVTLKKNAAKIPAYYHEEFLLFTNEEQMDYLTFLQMHQKTYETAIQYKIEYDEEAWVEADQKVAGRVWITVTSSSQGSKRLEVILIAKYLEKKLHRLWELTYPDWSNLPAFKQL